MSLVDDPTGLLLLLLLFPFGLGGLGVGDDDDDDMDDGLADVAEDDFIYDDTDGSDDGEVAGTSSDDVIFGGIAANGPAGAEGDTTTPDDFILGFSGDDTIFAGAGDDDVLAGSGDDVVAGGTGGDYLAGEAGDDSIAGQSGDDVIDGDGEGEGPYAPGSDLIYGGAGNDTLDGWGLNDDLYGGSGDDLIFGASGDDRIYGGSGEDVLNGGTGDDSLTGGPGDDIFQVDGGETLTDFGTRAGDEDFVDLTPYYKHLQEAQADLRDTGRLSKIDVDVPGLDPGDLTTANTGLADNTAPDAQNDTISFDGDTSFNLFAANPVSSGVADSDAEGDDFVLFTINDATIQSGHVNLPSGSVLNIGAIPNGTGQVTYQPGPGVNADSFTYTVIDTYGAESAPATVTLSAAQNTI